MSDQNALPPADSVVALAEGEAGAGRARSLASDAWRDLRRNPIAIISAVIIVILVLMAIWPSLFTNADPAACDLSRSLQPPSSEA